MRAFYEREKAKMYNRDQVCVNCGTDRGLTPQHIFGRTGTDARLGTPWCHLVECLACLCILCHGDIDDGHAPDQAARMKRLAIDRLHARLRQEGIEPPILGPGEPLNAHARRIVEFAVAGGWHPE